MTTSRPVVDADQSTNANLEPDPLMILLQRFEAELEAFNNTVGGEHLSQENWDRIAEAGWSRTQDQILQTQPPATTAAGALLALDYVLRNEDLFADRQESADQQMLWLLVKAARDYIAAMQARQKQDSQ